MAQAAEAKVTLSLEDKITAPIKRIKAQFSSISKSFGVDRIVASSKKVMASIKGIGVGFAESARRLGIFTGLLGIAGGGVIAGLMSLSKNTAEMGASLNDASKQLGIGVVNLQLWRFAAERSGMETGKFDQALASLSKKSAEAAKGNKASAATFKELGISVKDSSGKLKSNSVLMEEVAAKMGKIKDHAQRQRLASLLFGGDGKEMAAMMAEGMDPIKEMFNEARKGGWLIGKKVAEDSSKLMDNLGDLQDRLKGMRSFIGAKFMPVFNDILIGMKDWIDANREWIQTKIGEWIKKLRSFIADLKDPTSDLRKSIDGVIESVKGWLKWLEPITGKLGGFKIAIGAIALFILGPLISALTVAGVAVIGFGVTLMSTPIGWIIAGIAGLIAVGYALYKNWDKIWGYFSDMFERVRSAFDEGIIKGIMALLYEFNPLKLIVDAIGGISEYLFGVDLTEPAVSMIKSFFQGITDTFTGIIDFFANIGSQIWAAITSGDSFSDIGMNIINILWEGLKTGWSGVWNWFVGKIKSLTNLMPDWLKKKMGLDFTVDETSKSITETVEKSTAAVKDIKSNTPISPASLSLAASPQNENQNIDAAMMEATQVETQKFVVPEPIIAHQPANIDASVTIQNLTIETNGDPAEIKRIVNGVMKDHADRQQRSITSALVD